MPGMQPDMSLMLAVGQGNVRGADAALRGGASVDGDASLPIRPLMICAGFGNAKMAKFLIERGADMEIGTTDESQVGHSENTPLGCRAIHTAITSYAVEVVRVLIDAGADPISGDSVGRTPLMAACTLDTETERGRMVSLLLEAGADCTSRGDDGVLALHIAAGAGDTRVVDLLLSKAPSTLNHASNEGLTPLFVASQFGHARVVKQLLSAGASNKAVWGHQACPLRVAVDQGHDEVVGLLLTPRGMEAIGGASAVPDSITTAALKGRARILNLLIGVEGDEYREDWAKLSMLHDAASGGHLATISVLLAAGADEKRVGTNEMSVAEVAESYLPVEERSEKRSKAVHRILARGPAFRARSWAWPKKGSPVAADGGVFRAPGKEEEPPPGVRLFRGEGITCSVRLMER